MFFRLTDLENKPIITRAKDMGRDKLEVWG